MTEPCLSIIDLMDDKALLGRWFEGSSWSAWRAILKAAFALPMTPEEITRFRALAERDPPRRRVKELWIMAGRRAGKDSIASLIATYAAAACDYRTNLRPGELALILCLAVDRDQARIVLRYTRAYFDAVPMLGAMVTRPTMNGLELSNSTEIAIGTNDFRAVRGRSVAVAIFDECAYWSDEASATPDKETYRAVRPSLATIPGSMLIGITSPYRKSGLAYEKFRTSYGQDGDILVIKAPSIALNPTLDQAMIAQSISDDPEAARSEWLGEFRDDISAFVDRAVIDAAIVPGRRELPRLSGNNYVGFVDPSGGSADSMTLAIAHRDEDGYGVLDALRERRPPFSPEDVVEEFAALLKTYGVRLVRGDRYAGEWPRERFRVHGIEYEPCEKPKSDLYRDLLPILNSGRAELLDDPRLATQLCGLERRTARGGRDSIDHAPGGHDDSANAVAGALVVALGSQERRIVITPMLGQKIAAAYRRPRLEDLRW